MDNEIEIHVRIDDRQAKAAMVAVQHDVRTAADRAGDSFRTGFSGKLMSLFGKIGESLTNALSGASEKLGGFIQKAVGNLPPLGQAVAYALTAGLVAVGAPIIATALSTAVTLALGGGVLAAGIFAAFKSPGVQAAFEGLKPKLADIFRDFGQPFVKPLERAAETFSKVLDGLKPQITELGNIIAPVIDQLAPALGDFLHAVMPGIKSAVQASVPLFEVLASHLPKIGQALSEMFDDLSKNGPEMQQFFDDLLTVIEGAIIAVGKLISWMTTFYSASRSAITGVMGFFVDLAQSAINAFGTLLDGAVAAFGWIPGVGDKLRTAQGKFHEFQEKANGELNRIKKSITIDVRWRILGQAAANAAVRTASYLADVGNIGIRVNFSVVGRAAAQSAIELAQRLANLGYEHGGVVGAAANGGGRSGLTMVGEHGRELLDLPPGTTVHSNPDTERMMAGAGGGGPTEVLVSAKPGAGRDLIGMLIEQLQYECRTRYGSSSQVMFGGA